MRCVTCKLKLSLELWVISGREAFARKPNIDHISSEKRHWPCAGNQSDHSSGIWLFFNSVQHEFCPKIQFKCKFRLYTNNAFRSFQPNVILFSIIHRARNEYLIKSVAYNIFGMYFSLKMLAIIVHSSDYAWDRRSNTLIYTTRQHFYLNSIQMVERFVVCRAKLLHLCVLTRSVDLSCAW